MLPQLAKSELQLPLLLTLPLQTSRLATLGLTQRLLGLGHWQRKKLCTVTTGPLGPHGAPWGPLGPLGPLGAPWAPWGPNLAKSALDGGVHFQKNHKD